MAAVGDGLGETLLDEEAIRAEVARLGAEISADYADKTLHLVGVLKGAAVFLADLLRALSIPATMDFISIVPYGQVTASGQGGAEYALENGRVDQREVVHGRYRTRRAFTPIRPPPPGPSGPWGRAQRPGDAHGHG